MKIVAIAAMSFSRVIGLGGLLPWSFPVDLARFAHLTAGAMVLMGRKTFEALPPAARPLPGRSNVVVSRSCTGYPGVEICRSLEEGLRDFRARNDSGVLWIAGGGEIYCQSLPFWDEVYLTLVPGSYAGATYFPEFEGEFDLKKEECEAKLTFRHYVRRTA